MLRTTNRKFLIISNINKLNKIVTGLSSKLQLLLETF